MILIYILLVVSYCYVFYLSGDTRALSLRLFTEVASVYLSQDQFGVADAKVNTALLHKTIGDNLLPQ